MERLRFMPRDELLRVLHNNKTLMSCMERPHTFLSQLRDHGLIPEPSYKVSGDARTPRVARARAHFLVVEAGPAGPGWSR